MPIRIEELTKASLAVENARVAPEVYQHLLATLVDKSTGRVFRLTDPVEGHIVSVDRGRVQTKLQANRVEVESIHPSSQDIKRCAEIAATVFAYVSSIDPATVGQGYTYTCNVEAVYQQDSADPAAKYIADRFFHFSNRMGQGFVPIEGALKFGFREPETNNVWRLTVEPLVVSTDDVGVFIASNLTIVNSPLPVDATFGADLFQLVTEGAETLIDALEAPNG